MFGNRAIRQADSPAHLQSPHAKPATVGMGRSFRSTPSTNPSGCRLQWPINRSTVVLLPLPVPPIRPIRPPLRITSPPATPPADPGCIGVNTLQADSPRRGSGFYVNRGGRGWLILTTQPNRGVVPFKDAQPP